MLKLFRDNGILMSSESEWNMPYQAYVEKDYFRIVPIIIDKGMQQNASRQVYVTPKGLVWLQKLIAKKGLLPAQELEVPDLEAKYGKSIDDILMSVFSSDIEKNKQNAIPVPDVVMCCGKHWKLKGKVCGTCGRSLEFTRTQKAGRRPGDSVQDTFEKGKKITDLCERFVNAVHSADDLISKHSK